MRSPLRSTAVRLAFGYAAIFILSSLLLVGFLWWRTASYLDREVNAVILADAQAIGDRLNDFGLPGAIQTINERVGETGDEHAIYLLADPTLTPVAGNLVAWPAALGHDPGWHELELARGGQLHATRVLFVVLPTGFRLLVGRDVQDRTAIRQAVLAGLLWSAALSVVIAIAGGLLARRAVLRRLEAINRAAAAIVRGDLSQRVEVRGTSDEFDLLARNLNDMLQQIEILVEGVRNATHAVAHDLRTPLTELRGRIESLLGSRPSAEDVHRELQEAADDLDRVIDVFNALLRLAEIDSGARLAGFHEIDLDRIASEVVEIYGPVAEERGVALTLDAPQGTKLRGDPFLLAQALGNLVDNAVKYSPAPGKVTIDLARGPENRIELSVADAGLGISDEEKPRVTGRFYRGAAARGTAGSGLGLSLVEAVARLHGGSLVLDDAAPGLRATLVLPSGVSS
jgi:signal transduction histidine kinase